MKKNFLDLLRGTDCPEAATLEAWDDWRDLAKQKPVRYWLVEEALPSIRRAILSPYTLYREITWYLRNRYISKSHALTSNLKRGQYHEFETRLLNSLFDELINFVEIEEAWMHQICNKEKRLSWFGRLFKQRSPEDGLAHLKWASELIYDDSYGIDKSAPEYGKRPHQALAADEILELYDWWKNKHNNRPDPMDACGWSDHCKLSRNDQKKKDTKKLLDDLHDLEQAFEKEDTEMLVRLVKIRSNLWT